MVSALSFVCIFCVLLCVCVVLLVQNLNYSLTTFAFVLLFYSYSGKIALINVITLIILALRMHNSKAKPESIKFLSLNVIGQSNFHKRRAIFSWCRKQKADLISLQEAQSTTERQDQWRKEWGASVLFSHGSRNARGVAILIKNNLNITIQQSEISSDGRFIVLKAAINNEIYTIANISGPNKDADAVTFYRNLPKLLRNDKFGTKENIIIGGDFNCPLDITLDKKGGLPTPRKYVINSIDELQNEFSLHDIWRLKNPTLQGFTWGRCSPFIFCRLDYWLISDKLHDLVTKVDIIPSIKTDHSTIFLELEEIELSGRGAGFWKLNTSLLANENYKQMITNNLPTWLDAGIYMIPDICGIGSSLIKGQTPSAVDKIRNIPEHPGTRKKKIN